MSSNLYPEGKPSRELPIIIPSSSSSREINSGRREIIPYDPSNNEIDIIITPPKRSMSRDFQQGKRRNTKFIFVVIAGLGTVGTSIYWNSTQKALRVLLNNPNEPTPGLTPNKPKSPNRTPTPEKKPILRSKYDVRWQEGDPQMPAGRITKMIKSFNPTIDVNVGQKLLDMEKKYKIKLSFILSIADFDSSFATKGIAAVTHNPGNIRYVPGYPMVDKYDNPTTDKTIGYAVLYNVLQGLEEIFKLISKAYVTGEIKSQNHPDDTPLLTVDQIMLVYSDKPDQYIPFVKEFMSYLDNGYIRVRNSDGTEAYEKDNYSYNNFDIAVDNLVDRVNNFADGVENFANRFSGRQKPIS